LEELVQSEMKAKDSTKDRKIKELEAKLKESEENLQRHTSTEPQLLQVVEPQKGLPKTTEARKNRLKRADALFMKLLLSEKYKIGPQDLAKIIDPKLLASIAEESGLVHKIQSKIFKDLRSTINQNLMVGL
jgi:LAS superfamily LD-carboxypeptidase LdcB